jgi:HJR/Mrr/RecB family endonuclease
VAARVAHNYIVERARGGPGDGGIDVSAKARDDGHRLAVQCKDWPRSPVGEPIVQGFIDNARDYDERVLITTGELSGPAKALASRSGVTFIDHRQVEAWLRGEKKILRSER